MMSIMALRFNVSSVRGWSNGGYSSDPNNPLYGTHDWIAKHALDWLPTEEKQYILNNLAAYLYGTELPDSPSGIGDTVNHHIYYWTNESLQSDAAALRASEEYLAALNFLKSGNFSEASKTAGIMSHYIADVAVFGHVMGTETDWGPEIHHSDYETYVNGKTDNYTDNFNMYLSFDGELRVISAYDAATELAYDTTFDVNGDLKCVWMDQNYDWSNSTFTNRAGESLNLAANYLTDVLHTLYWEYQGYGVRATNVNTGLSYITIQRAINAPETLDGHIISISSGTYYEHLLVNKSLSLFGGSNTTIDGYNSGTCIKVVADNVNIGNLSLRNSGVGNCGILTEGSTGSNVSQNNMTNNYYGIRLITSNNSVFCKNIFSSNEYGISFSASSDNNTLADNNISNNTFGVHLENSGNNMLSGNSVSDNSYGMMINGSGDNNLTSNSVLDNTLGIHLNSSNNRIYHNIFIDNDMQANATEAYGNAWDDGYPSGGNYWSEFTDVDYYNGPHQNETDGDGIWDHEYAISIGNIDNYPVLSPSTDAVYNTNTHLGYTRIQDAIDASQTLNGHGIIVRSGTYNEHLTINKRVTLTGVTGRTILNGGGTGTVVTITTNNVTLRGFTIEGSGSTSPSLLLFYANNAIISDNTISNNPLYGIWLNRSDNFKITGNTITNNGEAIHAEQSNNGTIGRNIVATNSYGIVLIISNNNNVHRNNITQNTNVGTEILLSNNNLFYHNNFISNAQQVHFYSSSNIWDNGYPSGGNYWSNYAGSDTHSGPYQNATGSDGIGDTPYDVAGSGQLDRYPLVNPRASQHDVALVALKPSKTVAGQGSIIYVTITVENQGDYAERVNISFATPTTAGMQTMTLNSEDDVTIILTWNTASFPYGNYTISAYVGTVLGETDTADNGLPNVYVKIGISGDVNGDTVVDSTDLGMMGAAWGSFEGDLSWNPVCDLEPDGVIDSSDLGIMGAYWGEME